MVSDPNVIASVDDASHHLQQDKMSVAAVVFFVIAAVAPLGAVIGGSPVVFASIGAGAPAVYLLVGALFALFATGYVAMSRHITNAGGFVAYVAEGFGPRAASALAAVSIIGYLALVSAFWAFATSLMQWTFQEKFGVNIPPTLSLLVLIGLVTFLTVRGVDVSLRALGVLLTLEIAVLLILVVSVVVAGGDSGLSTQGISIADLTVPGFGIAFLFATTCFTGFEATVVFSEEVRDPKKSIPRAAYIGVTIIAVLYALVTWAISMGYGAANVQAAAQANPQGFILELAGRYAGGTLATAMEWMVFTSLLAMFIGFHNIVSRYIFAVARAGLLPNQLGLSTHKNGAPGNAALFMGVVVLIVNLGFLLIGLDPMTTIFPWLSALGTVAVIIGLVMASLSVVAFFGRTKIDTRVWHTKIAPVAASVGFLAAGVVAILNYDTLLGGQGSIARWFLLLLPAGALLAWIVAGNKLRKGQHLDYSVSLK